MAFDPEKYRQEKMKSPAFRVERILARNAIKLADRICTIREEKRISQQDLAQALGTKQSQISRFESSYYTGFSLRSLAKIADALGCDLDVELSPKAQAVAPSNCVQLPSTTGVNMRNMQASKPYEASTGFCLIYGGGYTGQVSVGKVAIEA
ncbi:MAG: helix-turn-helix transcriptional regulator [Cyanobacteria bacterium REEB67]|nr:helix-turn-helix transcriptional regulator [Cyanobacteria bacterium REEB67]